MNMNVAVAEVQMLLGEKDIEIYALKREITRLLAELEKLAPKTDTPR